MINFAILKSKNLFVYAIFGLFFFLLFALLMGQIPQYFSGEEFYVLHYANNFNFQEAIRLYFNQNGRLVEGIYWTLLYKTIGYNPPAAHFLSFFIHFATSIFASLCFIKIWPGKKLAFSKALLVILFFFNWFSLQWAFRLSADNMRISVLLYFVSGYLLQKWIATSGNLKYFYLSGAVILFLVSIFAYENTAFLFPALIFMAWPLRSQQGKSKNDGLANKLFILGIISLGFIFVPYYIYLIVGESLGRVIQHPATGGIVTNMDAFRVLLNWFYNLLYFIKGPVGFSYIVTLFLLCVGFYTIFVSGNRKKPFTDDGFLSRSLCISLASLWIIAMGLLPYSIANYVSTERVNSAAIFGLPPLLVLVFDIQKTKIIKTLSVLVIFYSISLGLIQYRDTSIERALREPELNGFYIGLKSVVPYVKAKTVFVFINYPLSNSGCARL